MRAVGGISGAAFQSERHYRHHAALFASASNLLLENPPAVVRFSLSTPAHFLSVESGS
jgi:hypothetical protein